VIVERTVLSHREPDLNIMPLPALASTFLSSTYTQHNNNDTSRDRQNGCLLISPEAFAHHI
jgi:hypothetical protein